jgi:hypothetical protein
MFHDGHGTEFCGSESHEYERYLAVEDIDHTRTKTKNPQTNGICERFPRTVWDEFYRVRSARRSTGRSTNYRPTSMPGSSRTTSAGRVRSYAQKLVTS